MLSLADYRCALALLEERHFRRAAERLGVTQPALTARLRRIEEVLGARLFERGRGGVAPTAAGLAFADGAQRILDTAEETADAVRGARDGLGETVRIGMTQVAAYQLVAPCLAAFRQSNPLARVKLSEGQTAGLEAKLEQRQVDIAFLHPPVHSSDISDKLLKTVPMGRFNAGEDADNTDALVRFPKNEAPVLMGALSRDEGQSPDGVDSAAEADTVLGVAILSQAGYGSFASPIDFPLPLVRDTADRPETRTRQIFETSIAWRRLDRRPVIRAMVEVAEAASAALGDRIGTSLIL
ncbi:MAG: LysR family transcriptional regulator [Pseudomonadota bacterium]